MHAVKYPYNAYCLLIDFVVTKNDCEEYLMCIDSVKNNSNYAWELIGKRIIRAEDLVPELTHSEFADYAGNSVEQDDFYELEQVSFTIGVSHSRNDESTV